MTPAWLVGASAAALCLAAIVARVSRPLALPLSIVGVLAGSLLMAWLGPGAPTGSLLAGGLALALILSRPACWRSNAELASLTSTSLLAGLVFVAGDLSLAIGVWLVSMWPGLRRREASGVSRRPLVLRTTTAGAIVLLGWAASAVVGPAHGTLLYVAVTVGAAARMGVPPWSPLTLAEQERAVSGPSALMMSARPSVAVLLAARAALPDQVATVAPALQAYAAAVGLLVAVQGLAAQGPRRQIGCMAATQSSMILYGLSSASAEGVNGALVQWVGLGISLVGLSVIVEAVESRVGRRRAERARGLLSRVPGLAFFFLFFAATMAGFPGTSGFVGEDLILRSAAHPAWPLQVALLLSTLFNGITMLRLFATTFLGPPSPQDVAAFPGSTARELLVLGVLACALLAVTSAPGVLRP